MKQIIIEVNKGRVWWISSDTNDWEAIVVNHDEGLMRRITTKLCSTEEIEDKIALCDMLEKEGMTEKFEEKLREVDPELFLKMKTIEQSDKERKDEK